MAELGKKHKHNSQKAAILTMLKDHTELYKHYFDNPSFKKELTDMIFTATYTPKTTLFSPPKKI